MAKQEQRNCPDCGGEMVEGFILDMAYGGGVAPRWIKGRPQWSWWSGLKNRKEAECRAVETYRCVGCGLLKLYATVEMDVNAGAPE
jgi:hypothetical protein